MILGLAEPCQDNYELHSKNSQPYLFILGLATNLPIHLWKTLPYLLYNSCFSQEDEAWNGTRTIHLIPTYFINSS